MKLSSIATPLTIGSSVALCMTGLCLLFGLRGGIVDPIHEISSIVFIGAIVMHILDHWKSTIHNIKQPLGASLFAIFMLLGFGAIATTFMGEKNDPRMLAHRSFNLLLQSNISSLANMTKHVETDFIGDLQSLGLKNIEPQMTLIEVAKANGKEPMEILSLALHERP